MIRTRRSLIAGVATFAPIASASAAAPHDHLQPEGPHGRARPRRFQNHKNPMTELTRFGGALWLSAEAAQRQEPCLGTRPMSVWCLPPKGAGMGAVAWSAIILRGN
jgi:hypothetical protein